MAPPFAIVGPHDSNMAMYDQHMARMFILGEEKSQKICLSLSVSLEQPLAGHPHSLSILKAQQRMACVIVSLSLHRNRTIPAFWKLLRLRDPSGACAC